MEKRLTDEELELYSVIHDSLGDLTADEAGQTCYFDLEADALIPINMESWDGNLGEVLEKGWNAIPALLEEIYRLRLVEEAASLVSLRILQYYRALSLDESKPKGKGVNASMIRGARAALSHQQQALENRVEPQRPEKPLNLAECDDIAL